LRGRSRPRRLIGMAGGGDAKVKRLRVSDGNAAGDCVIRILTLNGITTCIIVADAKGAADRRRRRCRRRRRRCGIISSSESETLAVVSLFSD
jgi:hypothetical protein